MNYTGLYALADALQIHLLVNEGLRTINGGRDTEFELSKGVCLTSKMRIVASYAAQTCTAVMVHVRKDLFLYAVAEYKGAQAYKEINLYLVNGKGPKGSKEVGNWVNFSTPAATVKELAPNIVAVFSKGHNMNWWEARDAAALGYGQPDGTVGGAKPRVKRPRPKLSEGSKV